MCLFMQSSKRELFGSRCATRYLVVRAKLGLRMTSKHGLSSRELVRD